MSTIANPNRFLAALLVVLFWSGVCFAQRPEPKKTEIGGHTMYTLLEPGAIPAIFDPEFISLSEAGEFYFGDEPLIVVVDGDDARGYSTWHLDQHEIVNDSVGGAAIAATW